MKLSIFTLALLAASLPAVAANITLNPSGGTLSGLPGSTVGWGFSLQGDASDWLVVTQVELESDPFPVGNAASFTDLLSVWVGNNDALAPGTTLTQAFAGGLGLASFAIPGTNHAGDVSAPLTIDVQYDLYDADPFTDGNADYIRSSDVTAAGRIDVVSVNPGSPGNAPEPATRVLIFCGLGLIAAGRRAATNR